MGIKNILKIFKRAEKSEKVKQLYLENIRLQSIINLYIWALKYYADQKHISNIYTDEIDNNGFYEVTDAIGNVENGKMARDVLIKTGVIIPKQITTQD